MPAGLAGLGMAASSLLVVLNAARLTRAPGLVSVGQGAPVPFLHKPPAPTLASLTTEPI